MAEFIGPLPGGNYLVGRLGRAMQFGGESQPSYVVVHTMGGSVSSIDARFKDPASHLSAHYGVGLDGSVVQWVSESDTAYHAGNWSMDLGSIGIEHEDDGDAEGLRTDALYAGSSGLVRKICLRYRIPISRRWIINHREVPDVATACPGTLDLDRIVAMASGNWEPPTTAMPAPMPIPEAPASTDPQATNAAQPAPSAEPDPEVATTLSEPAPPGNAPTPAELSTSPPAIPSLPQHPASPPSATQVQVTGEPLRDIAAAVYSDPGRWQDVYHAIQGVVAESPALAQLTERFAPPPAGNGQEVAAAESPATPVVVQTSGPVSGPPPPSTERFWGGSQGAVFGLQIVYLALLAGLAIAYFIDRSLIDLPDMLGPLPIAVPWFGALGAVLISLVGITQHRRDWDQSYRFWHWSRPLLGASFGSISVLIFQAGILAVGSVPTATTGNIPRNLLYFLTAFVVGYREETFRDLIKRLTDVIFTPGGTAAGIAINSMSPQGGPAAGGTLIAVLGAGFTDTDSVRFGTTPAYFQVDGDTQVTVTSPPGQAGTSVNVVITTKSASAIAGSFTYSAS